MKLCSIDECDKKVHGLGLCHPHYIIKKSETAPSCSVEGCERPTRVRAMCNRHYEKALRLENLEDIDYNDFWEFVKKERRIGMPNAKRI